MPSTNTSRPRRSLETATDGAITAAHVFLFVYRDKDFGAIPGVPLSSTATTPVSSNPPSDFSISVSTVQCDLATRVSRGAQRLPKSIDLVEESKRRIGVQQPAACPVGQPPVQRPPALSGFILAAPQHCLAALLVRARCRIAVTLDQNSIKSIGNASRSSTPSGWSASDV